MEKRDIENIQLILKNSKINILLASNNLIYINNIQNFKLENNILNLISRLNAIENDLDASINWIDDIFDAYNDAEESNKDILNVLTAIIEKQNIKIDVISDNGVKEKEVETENLYTNEKGIIFEVKKSSSKLDQEVGIIGTIFAATVAAAVVKTVTTAFKNTTGGDTRGTSGGSTGTGGTTSSGRLSTYNIGTNNLGNTISSFLSSLNNYASQFLSNVTSVVNNFTSKVNNYIKNTNTDLFYFNLLVASKNTNAANKLIETLNDSYFKLEEKDLMERKKIAKLAESMLSSLNSYKNSGGIKTDMLSDIIANKPGGEFSRDTLRETALACWRYLVENGNRYAYGGASIPITNGSKVDCSSFVSWVLYEYGYNQFYGSQHCTKDFFLTNWTETMGWEEIPIGPGEDCRNLIQPGDILVRDDGSNNGHVQFIYSIKDDGTVIAYDGGSGEHWESQYIDGYPSDFANGTWGKDWPNRSGKIIRINTDKEETTKPQSSYFKDSFSNFITSFYSSVKGYLIIKPTTTSTTSTTSTSSTTTTSSSNKPLIDNSVVEPFNDIPPTSNKPLIDNSVVEPFNDITPPETVSKPSPTPTPTPTKPISYANPTAEYGTTEYYTDCLKLIMDVLIDEGFTPQAAAGVATNIRYESTFNPTNVGDNGTSYGICQWHGGRWTQLENWLSANGYTQDSIEGQIRFILNGDYSDRISQANNIKNYTNAVNAAYDWCVIWEVPADKYNEAVRRSPTANTILEFYEQYKSGKNVTYHP